MLLLGGGLITSNLIYVVNVIIRGLIDYACAIYQSASKTTFKPLDTMRQPWRRTEMKPKILIVSVSSKGVGLSLIFRRAQVLFQLHNTDIWHTTRYIVFPDILSLDTVRCNPMSNKDYIIVETAIYWRDFEGAGRSAVALEYGILILAETNPDLYEFRAGKPVHRYL